jgi:hypothetical protein
MVIFNTFEDRVLEILQGIPEPGQSENFAQDSKNEEIPLAQYPAPKESHYNVSKGYIASVRGLYGIRVPDLTSNVPFMHVERVPGHVLGEGVLGRTYTGLGHVQIREDLYGDDFLEVYVHELKHSFSPWLSEQQVRFWTKQLIHTRYH